MPSVPKHIFCQCMKPWKICVNKPNSYKIDGRDLLDVWAINRYIFKPNIKLDLNYDFINLKPLNRQFCCRFTDKPIKP
jgi:hypothetical protein